MAREVESAKFPEAKVVDSDIGVATNREGKTLTAIVPDQTSDTTIDLSDTQGIEQDEYGMLVGADGYEIGRVTSVDANQDEATITRGEDGTTERSFEENDSFVPIVPAKTINQLRAETVAMQDWLGKDGDTVPWDRAIQLRYTGTSGTPTLEVGTVSGQGDPEPLIHFSRSTDGGDTWSTVGQIDYDPGNDQLEMSNIELVGAAGAHINLEDDQELRLGTDYDLRARWDGTNARTELATDNALRLQRQASVTDASALDSPVWAWEGRYDSDATGSSVTEATRTIGAQLVTEYASSNGQYRLAWTDDAGSEFVTFEGDTQRVGVNATAPNAALDVRGSVIFNEDAGSHDVRMESTSEQNMFLLSADQDQVNVHKSFNADWGALNVGARNASNGTEVDMVATLSDSGDSADVNGNNQDAWGVRVGNPTLNSVSGATTVTDSAALYVPGPLQAGTDLTITNQYVALFEDGAGNKLFRFTSGGDFTVESGSLGVGETSPLADVHITNNQAALTEARLDNTDASGSMAYTLYDGSNKRGQLKYDTAAAVLDLGTDITSGQVAISTNTDVEALRLDASQNVDVVAGALQVGGTTLFENDRDLAVDLIPNSANSLDLGSTTREFANLFLADNASAHFGSDQDWLIDYDATNTKWRLHDGTNEVFSVDDGTQIVDFQGSINFANSNAIQDTGTDAIDFDGSGLVQAPVGLMVGSKTNTNATLELNEGGPSPTFDTDADPATVSTGDFLNSFRFRWGGTIVGTIAVQAGDDTTDKDDGDIQFRTANNGALGEVLRLHQEGHVEMTSVGHKYTGTTETNDGMTSDPETATEDAFISVDIGGNSYQIPLYSA